MKYIVVDLEMNPLAKEYVKERAIWNNEIIEIGAVLLDEKYQEIGQFITLVKPQYNDKIERKIERLTGIKTEMVESAPVFEEAIGMFFSWCASIPGEKQVCQWSTADNNQILGEIKLKNYITTSTEEAFLEGWCDFQREYGDTLGVSRALSLTKAMDSAGVDFVGRKHDALFDARNTGTLMMIVRDEDKRNAILSNVIEALAEKPIGTTMGDLFNFNLLNLPS